jgi:hypothetical protein
MFFTPMHPGKPSERFTHMGQNDHHETGGPENLEEGVWSLSPGGERHGAD